VMPPGEHTTGRETPVHGAGEMTQQHSSSLWP
jgi:hypothetical protein